MSLITDITQSLPTICSDRPTASSRRPGNLHYCEDVMSLVELWDFSFLFSFAVSVTDPYNSVNSLIASKRSP